MYCSGCLSYGAVLDGRVATTPVSVYAMIDVDC